MKNIVTLFEAAAKKYSDKIAIVEENIKITFQELNEKANILAHTLLSFGVQKEELIAVYEDRSIAIILCQLAILKAGCAYLPIDPAFPNERVQNMIDDGRVKYLLSSGINIKKIVDINAQILDSEALLKKHKTQIKNPNHVIPLQQLAYVIFTSGSTGRPKGVEIEHQSIANLLQEFVRIAELNDTDRTLMLFGVSFDASILDIWAQLLVGATIYIPSFEVKIDIEKIIDYCQKNKITLFFLPTPLAEALLKNERHLTLTQMRILGIGGEKLKVRPKVTTPFKVLNFYGPTEATVAATCGRVDPESEKFSLPHIGKALQNYNLSILDKNNDHVPQGTEGELCIAGISLARGYRGQPDLTAKSFVYLKSGERVYKTGDIARYLSDGNIEIVGRNDDQVKIRGQRIELGEIECAISEVHQIKRSYVTTFEDSLGEKHIVAYIILQDPLLTKNDLRGLLGHKLTKVMIPSAFIFMTDFPLTVNGKVDRKKLPVPTFSDEIKEHEMPRSGHEKTVFNAFAKVLNKSAFSIFESFFNLGGHSLQIAKLTANLNQTFSINLKAADIFEYSTVAELSDFIEKQEKIAKETKRIKEKPAFIKVQNRNKPLTLSYEQQQMLHLYQLNPQSDIYNIPIFSTIQGVLNFDFFKNAVEKIVQRHEILRTNYRDDTQNIHPEKKIEISYFDLCSYDENERKKHLHEMIDKDAHTPFLLFKDLPIRCSLFKLKEDECTVLFNVHHIAFDAWSNDIFWRELVETYNAILEGREAHISQNPFDYADYAAWQQSAAFSKKMQDDLSYWKEELSNANPLLNFPTDYKHSFTTMSISAQKIRASFDKETLQQITTFCKEQNITLFLFFLSCYYIIVAKYANQLDLVIGIPSANRDESILQNIIGYFVNTLPVRIELSENDLFIDIVAKVKSKILQAQAHQNAPLTKIIEECAIERTAGHATLIQTIFNYTQKVDFSSSFKGTKIIAQELHQTNSAKFDFSFHIEEGENAARLSIEYKKSLYAAETMQQLLENFLFLVKNLLQNTGQNYAKICVSSVNEQKKILQDWNKTAAAFPNKETIVSLFEKVAKIYPDKIAIVESTTTRQITYKELSQKSDVLAMQLIDMGVQKEDLIAVLEDRSIRLIVSELAILKAGCAYLAIDPSYPSERVQGMLEDGQVKFVIDQNFEIKEPVSVHQNDFSLRLGEISANQLACVIFTSGSTGRPKGVELEHQSLVNFMQWHQQEFNIMPETHVAMLAGVGFDASAKDIWATLLTGATLYIPEQDVRVNVDSLFRYFNKHKIEACFATTPLAELIIDKYNSGTDISLHTLTTGGDKLKLRPKQNSTIQLYNGYGPTEATIYTTCALVEKENGQKDFPHIGKPLSNYRVYILDKHNLPVPRGVIGELCIAGSGLSRGYRNKKDLTAEKFVTVDIGAGIIERVYKTGDLSRYLVDGNIEIIGRNDDQVKIRGQRIELGEVEHALASLPHVSMQCVIVKENATGEKQIIAYIIPSNSSVTKNLLRESLATKLTTAMMPANFVFMKEFPFTPNGKIDKKKLPLPESVDENLENSPPRSPMEEKIYEAYSLVLKKSSFSIFESFFHLGGHSLLVAKLVSQINKILTVQINISDIFKHQSVASLASYLEVENKVKKTPVTIKRVDRKKRLLLSFEQEQMYYLYLTDPTSDAYNIPLVYKITGALNIDNFFTSVKEMIDRNEILRTTYHKDDSGFYQRIYEHIEDKLNLNYKEITSTEELSEIIAHEGIVPFDLENDLMLKCSLFKKSECEYYALFNFHHIAFDGFSIDIFWQELTGIYNKTTPPDDKIQYADYAGFQHTETYQKSIAEDLDYWKKELALVPPLLNLPFDKKPQLNIKSSAAVRTVCASLNNEILQNIRLQCKKNDLTSFMFLFSCYQTMLAKYTSQNDVVAGFPVAHRPDAELQNIVGYFVNTLPLRIQINENNTFQDILLQVKEKTLKAQVHQNASLGRIVEESRVERISGHAPLIQTFFDYRKNQKFAHSFAETQIEPYPIGKIQTAKFDLHLNAIETEEEILLSLEYKDSLFYAETMQQFLENFVSFAESIALNVNQPFSKICVASFKEQGKILLDWNKTKIKFPKNETIVSLVEKSALKYADKIAVVEDNKKITYRELNAQANALAHKLIEMGLEKEELIGVYEDRSISLIICELAILKAGCAFLPIDPVFPNERVNNMLSDGNVKVIITSSENINKTKELNTIILNCELIFEEYKHKQENPNLAITENQLAYVIFTSGSTGRPKGVEIEHHSLLNFVQLCIPMMKLSEDDRVPMLFGVSFDPTMMDTWPQLITGASIYIPSYETKIDIDKIVDYYLKNKLTASTLPTPLAEALLRHERHSLLTDLRVLGACGEKLKVRPSTTTPFQLLNGYGPTEATVLATQSIVTKDGSSLPHIGKPLANYRTYILDKGNNPVPRGVIGELCLAGEGLARSYRGRSDLTADKFITVNLGVECTDRIYKTGDLARYLPDGNIEIVGRNDDQVKIRGQRIELGEIEHVLSTLPDIKMQCVLVKNDEHGEKQIIACIVPRRSSLTPQELRGQVSQKLTATMVPARFVFMTEFPMTPNGKIDKKGLIIPVFTDDDSENIQEESLPNTPLEKKIFEIFSEVLKKNSFSIFESFFNLGGHSLLVAKIVGQLNNTLSIQISIADFFNYPSVSALSTFLENSSAFNSDNKTAYVPVMTQIDRNTRLRLSFEQEQMFHLYLSNPKSDAYNVPLVYKVTGNLNIVILARSIKEMIARHEIFRTTYQKDKDGYYQNIHDISTTPAHNLIVKKSLYDRSYNEIIQSIQTEASSLFDLEKDLMIKCTLFEVKKNEYYLLFNLHHIAFDGSSIDIFWHELTQIYNAIDSGKSDFADPSKVQYADYAAWQNSLAYKKILEKDLAYWNKELVNVSPILNFPIDKKRTLSEGPAKAQIEHASLDKLALQNILAKAKELNVTPFMFILACYQVLLAKYSNQNDIVTGFPVAHRPDPELQNMIGYFVNTLPLRMQISDTHTFEDILLLVKEKALQAQVHQNVSLGKIIQESKIERFSGYDPLIQNIFDYSKAHNFSYTFSDTKVTEITFSELDNAKFDLSFHVVEADSEIKLAVAYKEELFHAKTMVQFLENFVSLIKKLSQNTKQSCASLCVSSQKELKKVLLDWNQTETKYPENETLISLFQNTVKNYPDKIAIVEEKNKVTYKELNEKANCIAHKLLATGVRPEELIAVYDNRSIHLLACELAILKAGCSYLPIHPSYPEDRVKNMLEDGQVGLILTSSKNISKIENIGVQVLNGDLILQENTDKNEDLNIALTPNQLAYVIFTSGSTGRPKGVEIEHRSIVNFALQYIKVTKLNFQDRVPFMFGVSFDGSCMNTWPQLLCGASIYIPPADVRIDSDLIIDYYLKHKITMSDLPTPLAEALINNERHELLTDLKILGVGGEKLKVRPKLTTPFQVLDYYGPTESTVAVTHALVTHEGFSLPHIGKPLPNYRVYILDKNSIPVPVGVTGELCIAGVGLARCYRGRADLTAEKFVTWKAENILDSNILHEKLYKTGDLARYLSDGNIEILGRSDDQVKIRGHRIELGEVEQALSSLPDIKMQCVLVKDAPNGEKQIVAYLITRKNSQLTRVEIKHLLSAKLTTAMMPSHFVFMDNFPITPNGKVDKKKLPEPIYEEETLTEVLTDNEKIVYDVFKAALNIEHFSKYDSFFELGGHSLLVAKILTQIREKLKISLPLPILMQHNSVAELTEALNDFAQHTQTEKDLKKVHEERIKFLRQESLLPSYLYPESTTLVSSQPNNIFLTGVTGFFGPFILEELLNKTKAKIYCHVRAKDEDDALFRIEGVLIKSKIRLKAEDFFKRIVPVCGDLEQPYLGITKEKFEFLTKNIDAIYHNGAYVHSIYGYDQLRAANVTSTLYLIEMASVGQAKALHYVSTMNVLGACKNPSEDIIEIPDDEIPFYVGYAETKIVAERLIMEAQRRGFQASIYRLGRITAHSKTHVCNTNDTMYRLIMGCIELGSAPIEGAALDFGAVDYMAEAFVALSLDKSNINGCYHIQNPNTISWSDFLAALDENGCPLRRISHAEWVKELKKHPGNPFYSYLSIIEQPAENENQVESTSENNGVIVTNSSRTIKKLEQYGIFMPKLTKEFLKLNVNIFCGL